MPVDTFGVIDAIGIETSSGHVVLNIADHLEWEPLQDHVKILGRKIDSYISFIENDEMQDSFPVGVGRPILIRVWCKYCPTQAAVEALGKFREIIEEAGWSFTWDTPNDDAAPPI